MALLAHVHRRVLRLHADALPRHGRQRAPLLGVHGRLPETADSLAPVHNHRGAVHRSGAADFPLQPGSHPAAWTQGLRQRLGGHDARMVHDVAPTVRQLRRSAPDRVPRPERVRNEECRGGLRHAGLPRARGRGLSRRMAGIAPSPPRVAPPTAAPAQARTTTEPPPPQHGLHVLGGLGGLVYVLHRVRGTTGPLPLAALGAATLYWHFMGGLWLYLLVILVTRV